MNCQILQFQKFQSVTPVIFIRTTQNSIKYISILIAGTLRHTIYIILYMDLKVTIGII